MVAFNDRRSVALTHPSEAPGLNAGSGVSLSRKVINGCFIVQSSPNTELGRSYSVHEVLPTHETVVRDEGFPTRYAAGKAARGMAPSNVREL